MGSGATGRRMSLVSLLSQGTNNLINGMAGRIIYTTSSFLIYIFIKCSILLNQTILPDLLQKWSVLNLHFSFPQGNDFPLEWLTLHITRNSNSTLVLLPLVFHFLGLTSWIPATEDREFSSLSSPSPPTYTLPVPSFSHCNSIVVLARSIISIYNFITM